MPDAHTRSCDLLLTGGTVVTVDGAASVHDPGYVAITANRIVGVGPAGDRFGWAAAEEIDCRGKAVLPGFVDGHNHLYQALARGLGEGMSIVPWLCEFMWPYSIAVNHDDAVAGAELGVVEALRTGITTIIDNHYAPSDLDTTLAVADVIERAGARGAVARGIVGERTAVAAERGQPPALFRYTHDDEIAITRDAMRSRPHDAKVSIWPAPLNLTYVDQELVAAGVALARALDTRWHTHCCEGSHDPHSYVDAYGLRPVQWLAKEGLLDRRATLAHAIWLDDDDLQQVIESGAGVAHNPTSNAYLASGTAPVPELRSANVPIALGTDGPSCGHRQDMFELMKQTVFLQRLHTLDPTALRAADALELATREGARYAGVDAGVLAEGRLADVVVVDLGKPHLQPVHDIVATLVYSARGSDVDVTIVDGQVVYRDGRCTLIDEQAAIAHARERADLLLARAGITTPRASRPA
jgi:5-methylthioadenosine/S-adenosylhomocysteine deaminase